MKCQIREASILTVNMKAGEYNDDENELEITIVIDEGLAEADFSINTILYLRGSD